MTRSGCGKAPSKASQGIDGGSAFRRGLGFLVETLKDVYILAATRRMADICLHKFYA
jgi:hypothetical protein